MTRRSWLAAALACGLGALPAGCAVLGSEGTAEQLATMLAGRLGAHTLDGVPLSRDSAREAFAEQVSALVDHPVEVDVVGLDAEERSAEATLAWRWTLPGHSWGYTTTVGLVDDGTRWEVEWSPSALEPSLGDGHDLGVSVLPGSRGRILGEDDVALVEDRPVLRYGLDKTQVRPRQIRASARRIADVLDVERARFVGQVEAAGPEAFVEALVLRVEDAREQVDPAYARIPGAVVLEAELPLAPTRTFAAEVLGRVGPATAEIIEESGGRVGAGDLVGISGLQARYDAQLAGSAGFEVYAVSPDGQRRTLTRRDPQPGQDLRTTLDPAQQGRAEQVLAGLGEDGPRSALIAVRPSDGSVLAAANGPGNQGLNVATAGRYAPGSTFKLVTALALLRAGVAPEDPLTCRVTTEVDGRTFKNYDDYPAHGIGDITFTEAIAHSCNTALIDARERLGPEDLAGAAAALGLGPDHDLGFPAYFGQVPPPREETEEAAQLIGQGTVLASPLTMASVAASISAGRVVIPTLLPDHPMAPWEPRRPLTTPESAVLQTMMHAVVTKGSGRFLADLPGDVGAKTGTAEYGQPDANGDLATHAWMVATRGDLAVAVFVETGESGSASAGPLLEEFLRGEPAS